MDQVHVIRHAVLKQGRSRRSVALELGVSRNTVRKYLEESEPRFSAPVGRRQPVLERVKARLDELLAEWSARTTAKQRITGSRLHGQLRMEGFDVGITLVRQYFRAWRRQRQETFVPLVHRPRETRPQVDFFEVTVEGNGERRKALMFAMRLMYSGRDDVWLYERCDQLSFLDAHVRAFAHVGGVPRRCVYDNRSAAVRKVVFPRRQLTARFTALSSHSLFEPCFARPGEGHDKGGIESRGKGIRLQHVVPIPRARSLEACGELLHRRIEEQSATRRGRDDTRTVMERFAEEQSALRAIPEVEVDSRKVLPVIDFVLSRWRDAATATRLFRKALTDPSHPQPRVINTDQARLYGSAIAGVKKAGLLRRRCRHQNHSNHRGLSRIRPALSHLGRSGIHRRLNRRVCASRRQSSRSRGEALRCCALVGSRARLPLQLSRAP